MPWSDCTNAKLMDDVFHGADSWVLSESPMRWMDAQVFDFWLDTWAFMGKGLGQAFTRKFLVVTDNSLEELKALALMGSEEAALMMPWAKNKELQNDTADGKAAS